LPLTPKAQDAITSLVNLAIVSYTSLGFLLTFRLEEVFHIALNRKYNKISFIHTFVTLLNSIYHTFRLKLHCPIFQWESEVLE
jgi:hypothetical protein